MGKNASKIVYQGKLSPDSAKQLLSVATGKERYDALNKKQKDVFNLMKELYEYDKKSKGDYFFVKKDEMALVYSLPTCVFTCLYDHGHLIEKRDGNKKLIRWNRKDVPNVFDAIAVEKSLADMLSKAVKRSHNKKAGKNVEEEDVPKDAMAFRIYGFFKVIYEKAQKKYVHFDSQLAAEHRFDLGIYKMMEDKGIVLRKRDGRKLLMKWNYVGGLTRPVAENFAMYYNKFLKDRGNKNIDEKKKEAIEPEYSFDRYGNRHINEHSNIKTESIPDIQKRILSFLLELYELTNKSEHVYVCRKDMAAKYKLVASIFIAIEGTLINSKHISERKIFIKWIKNREPNIKDVVSVHKKMYKCKNKRVGKSRDKIIIPANSLPSGSNPELKIVAPSSIDGHTHPIKREIAYDVEGNRYINGILVDVMDSRATTDIQKRIYAFLTELYSLTNKDEYVYVHRRDIIKKYKLHILIFQILEKTYIDSIYIQHNKISTKWIKDKEPNMKDAIFVHRLICSKESVRKQDIVYKENRKAEARHKKEIMIMKEQIDAVELENKRLKEAVHQDDSQSAIDHHMEKFDVPMEQEFASDDEMQILLFKSISKIGKVQAQHAKAINQLSGKINEIYKYIKNK